MKTLSLRSARFACLGVLFGALIALAEEPPQQPPSPPHTEKAGPKGDDDKKPKDPILELNQPPKAAVVPQRKAGAKPSGVCNDLYRFTCAPGKFDDGTGAAYSKDKIQERVEEVKKEQQPAFEAAFLKKLEGKDDDSVYFRGKAMKALGFFGAPPCSDDTQKIACNTLLKKGLAEVALNRLLEQPGLVTKPKGPGPVRIKELAYLLQNPVYSEVEAELVKAARAKLIDEKGVKKIETEVFPRVRKLVSELVAESIADADVRKNVLEKIKGIKFLGSDCARNEEAEKHSVSALVVPNAFYDPIKNTFKYCNGLFLQGQSAFQQVQTIAHELAHSFDPCNITLDDEDSAFHYSNPKSVKSSSEEFPFEGIIACLRDEASVGAKRAPRENRPKAKDPLLATPALKSKQPPGDRIAPQDLPLLPPGLPPDTDDEDPSEEPFSENSPFCSNREQVGEAFADAIAGRVLPKYIREFYKAPPLTATQYINGYANVFRGNCDLAAGFHQDDQVEGFDEHPPIRARVNRILLTNPDIRTDMGCKAEAPEGTKDCPFKKANKE